MSPFHQPPTTTPVRLTPPNGSLFAAAQVEYDGEVIGANPAFQVEYIRDSEGNITGDVMHPLPSVTVDCYLPPDAKTVVVHWVYEDSNRGLETVTHNVKGKGRGWRR